MSHLSGSYFNALQSLWLTPHRDSEETEGNQLGDKSSEHDPFEDCALECQPLAVEWVTLASALERLAHRLEHLAFFRHSVSPVSMVQSRPARLGCQALITFIVLPRLSRMRWSPPPLRWHRAT